MSAALIVHMLIHFGDGPVASGAHLNLGDKEKADEYKQYNAGHVSDIVQPGATAWHTD